MDFSAAIFGFTILAISAWVAYRWGIKPDRERRKQQSERILAELRRQRGGKMSQQRQARLDATRAATAATLHRQSSS